MRRSYLVIVILIVTLFFVFSFRHGSMAEGRVDQLSDLEALISSPLSRFLSSGGFRAILLITGRIPRIDYSSRDGSGRQAPSAAIGPEIRVNNPAADLGNQTTQSETSIAVTGTNVVIGWNDTQVCCKVGATRLSGFGASHDGGITFEDHGVIPAPSGIDLLGDPAITADHLGNFYYASLAAKGSLSGIIMEKSTNGGVSFTPVSRIDINPTQPIFQDKEYIAADTNPSSPFMGNIYASWSSFGLLNIDIDFARSTDGGTNFSPAITINSGGISRAGSGSVPAVDRQGRVYVVWEDFRATQPSIRISRSDDGGLTFGAGGVDNIKIADVSPIGSNANCGGNMRVVLNGDIRVTEFPTIAIDKTTGPNSGNLYVAWNDNRNGDPDILFSRSTDGGITWSAPLKVNNDAATSDQFMPWMTAESNGAVTLIWYDRRLDPTNNRLIDVFAARSTDGGLSFNINGRVTTTSFDVPPLNPNFDPAVSDCYMGDYIGITSDGTSLYAAWGDNRDIQNGHPDPDIFFRKATP